MLIPISIFSQENIYLQDTCKKTKFGKYINSNYQTQSSWSIIRGNKVNIEECVFEEIYKQTNNLKYAGDNYSVYFFAALASTESDFNPNKIGKSVNEVGIMQLNPITISEYNLKNSDTLIGNIKGAIKYIQFIDSQLKIYCPDFNLLNEESFIPRAASYNAGTWWMRQKDSNGNTCNMNKLPNWTKHHYLKRFSQRAEMEFINGGNEIRFSRK